MKKIITIVIWLFILINLASCWQTDEEKAQEKAMKWWLWILYEMWKQAENWASDDEIINNWLDKFADLAWSITDWTDQELTWEEKDAIKKWANLLKDWWKWLQEEIMETINEQQAEMIKELKEQFWDAEQLKWAEDTWIITPEWLEFNYMMANKKDGFFYKSYYKADSDKLLAEWKRLIKELWLETKYEVTKEEADEFNIEQVNWYWNKDWYKYYINANSRELIFQVTRPYN